MLNAAFKTKLHHYCISILEQRIETNRKAMLDAQQSANSEEKSSAGDKYETGRAMNQIQRNMSAKQLKVAMEELAELKRINPEQQHDLAMKGALIETETAVIYIATGLGMVDFESIKVAVVSVTSPVAAQLIGKKVNDIYSIAARQHRIINIH